MGIWSGYMMCTCEMHVKWLLKYGDKDGEYNILKGLLMYDKYCEAWDLQICNKYIITIYIMRSVRLEKYIGFDNKIILYIDMLCRKVVKIICHIKVARRGWKYRDTKVAYRVVSIHNRVFVNLMRYS